MQHTTNNILFGHAYSIKRLHIELSKEHLRIVHPHHLYELKKKT